GGRRAARISGSGNLDATRGHRPGARGGHRRRRAHRRSRARRDAGSEPPRFPRAGLPRRDVRAPVVGHRVRRSRARHHPTGRAASQLAAAPARRLALRTERWRLAEENRRRARETHALLEAGRAVTASLDVNRTIRVLLEEARGVLGVDSCGLLTIDPATDEL